MVLQDEEYSKHDEVIFESEELEDLKRAELERVIGFLKTQSVTIPEDEIAKRAFLSQIMPEHLMPKNLMPNNTDENNSIFSVFYNKCVDAFNCLLCPATCISGAKNDGKLMGLETNPKDIYL